MSLRDLKRSILSMVLVWAALLPIAGFGVTFDWNGLVDLRGVSQNADRNWTERGLGKLRFGGDDLELRLGQVFLVGRTRLSDELTGTVIVSAADDRAGLLDVTELYLAWRAVPRGPWRTRLKMGAFFPPLSLENDGPAWTTTRTLSSSAINSWLGEEFRTVGFEYQISRQGALIDSTHDLGLVLGVFGWNDPAGTLISWRGWSISDRITGLHETVRLADLPVYQPTGRLRRQDDRLEDFLELDRRPGFYLGAQYGEPGRWSLHAMHYDNRADPTIGKRGQYGWQTRFNHLGFSYEPVDDWEFLAQTMVGDTIMGRSAVAVRFQSWYALASKITAQGRATLRFDTFRAGQHDRLPSDNNDEDGRAWTAAYSHSLRNDLKLVGEWVESWSDRPARLNIGKPAERRENSLTVGLRWYL